MREDAKQMATNNGAMMMSRQGQVLAGWIVTFAMAVLCVGCDGGSPAPTPVDESASPSQSVEIDQFSKDEARAYAAKWNGRMKISGTVKDEAGKVMSKVTCFTRETLMEANGPAYQTRTRELGGTFSLEFNKVAHVQIELSAPDYFTEKMEFEFLSPSPGVVNNNGTQQYTIDVALTRQPSVLATLVEHSSRLALDPTGLKRSSAPAGSVARVFPLVDLRENGADSLNIAQYLTATAPGIQGPYICLEAIADPAAPMASRINSDGEVQPLSPPGYRIFLTLKNDPSGGFIPFVHPTKGEKYQLGFPREMQEAPAVGYSTSVEIKPDWFVHSETSAFFYFRSGGLYGRARIRPAYNPEQFVEASLRVQVEPNGSRWIATGIDNDYR